MKVLSLEENMQLLAENYIGRIGYTSKGRIEIIPITYFFDSRQNSIVSYSGPGNKIDSMRKSGCVSFQVDEVTTLSKWKSILLFGKFEELNGIDAKQMLHAFSEGVKKTISQKGKSSPNFISEFSSKKESAEAAIVYRINIEGFSGRARE